ncbi:P-loop containing nucleoside triphosphate hydrolase protein [Penicillium cataractarum]|uniref:P-loop containing nucleoside triphosphate hydrolase protein n=1 Tax=Penicillium cataractarum TaxID=2100454 RepID=A0A9W9SH48_9EURO|nr:P-loop containing nucleoside triphosphate hydrolase protein [Penicillium cataractarum]KAJ5377910.1 P-loop containing nucleoside triphosphate hydrolase protein [Penicillium cataractarum]
MSTTISFGEANLGAQVGVNNGTVYLSLGMSHDFFTLIIPYETRSTDLSRLSIQRDPRPRKHPFPQCLSVGIQNLSIVGMSLPNYMRKLQYLRLSGLVVLGKFPNADLKCALLMLPRKSQIAIEYCYRVRDESPDTWVFWIHASNATRFEQSCWQIVNLLETPGRNDPKSNPLELLRDWLHDSKNGRWILVLDNLDDKEFIHSTSSTEPPIWAYFPSSLEGSILLTSRSRHVASTIVEDDGLLMVKPMSESDAITLFDQKTKGQGSKEDTAELVAALDFMPLAIVQAASYIKQRAPRVTVTQYLKDIQSDQRTVTLLENSEHQHRRDWDAENASLLTWQISFDHIQRERPSAAGLLSLMSFCDRQGIPTCLLKNRSGTQVHTESGPSHNGGQNIPGHASEDWGFEDDILTLRGYSMIALAADETTFEMHRLVQLATQEWLRTHKHHEQWEEEFIKALNRAFPNGDFESWPMCRLLLPHIHRAMEAKPQSEVSLRIWAMLLLRGAWFSIETKNIAGSMKMAENSRAVNEQILGNSDPMTLGSSEALAEAFNLAGNFGEAERLHAQVWKARKRILGAMHTDTIRSVYHLASIFQSQRRFRGAKRLGKLAARLHRHNMGPEHSCTLAAMSVNATTYQLQQKWKEAEDIRVQVYKTYLKTLGPEHPDTLTSAGNLATVYTGQGRWEDAERMLLDVMETKRRVLGPEDPSILATLLNLAALYYDQSLWEQAEKLQHEALETSIQINGPDHPVTITAMNNLSAVYLEQKRYKEAEALQLQVIETGTRTLGPEHVHTVGTMTMLKETYVGQGRFKEAEGLAKKVLVILKRVNSP